MRTNLAKAVRRSLVLELLDHGQIKTREALAKSVQSDVDKVINLLKENSVNAKRQLVKILGQEIKPKRTFSDRRSGYTRIVKLGQRFSDTTEMVVLELVDKIESVPVVEPAPELPKKLKEPKALKAPKKTKNVKSN